MDEGVACVALVLGADDVGVIGFVDEPELDELLSGTKYSGDQIRARFFRAEYVPSTRPADSQVLRDAARAVADHFVHVGRQLTGDTAPLLGRSASSALHANSRRNSGSVDLS